MHASSARIHRGAKEVKLHAGCAVRFGFMRQNNISGRILTVTDVSSYVFDKESFASYQLRDDETDISLIVAEGNATHAPYMAISTPLREKWFHSLFAANPPKDWERLKRGSSIDVCSDRILLPEGWLDRRYTYVLSAQGHKVSGDFRKRALEELTGLDSHPFEYVLLVSESGEHAIEAEFYKNGTIRVFATVYRPLNDIAEITQMRRPYIIASNPLPFIHPKEEAVTPSPALQEEPEEPEVLQLQMEDSVPEALPVSEVPEPAAAPVAAVAEPLPLPPAAPTAPQQMLACDALLAARIIDEARRNKLSLADVIRKVIDLPATISDKVYLPLALSQEELAVLSKRYELAEGDYVAVQEKIIEELGQFAGVK